MRRRIWIGILAVACGLAAASAVRAEPIAIITSASGQGTGAGEIRRVTLRRVYLGRITRLGGTRLDPLHLGSGTEARSAFSAAVLGRSEQELEEYWIEQALRGGRIPPRELASPAQVIEYVARRPGAIGYVPLSSLGSVRGVRVLRIRSGGRSLAPGDPGYPLRTP